MAGLETYCNSILVRKNKLAENIIIESSNTPISFPAISRAQTLSFTHASTFAHIFASTPDLPSIYMDIDL